MFSIPEILGLWSVPGIAQAILMVVIGVVTATQGMKHGWHYAHLGMLHSDVPKWFSDRFEIHYVDRRFMIVLYVLFIAAGVDAVAVFLSQTVARPLFQGFINAGSGDDFFRGDELDYYREEINGKSRKVPKSRWKGIYRWYKAGIALITICFYDDVLRFILEAMHLEGVLSFLS